MELATDSFGAIRALLIKCGCVCNRAGEQAPNWTPAVNSAFRYLLVWRKNFVDIACFASPAILLHARRRIPVLMPLPRPDSRLPNRQSHHGVRDDFSLTQLTLGACEALQAGRVFPKESATAFARWFRAGAVPTGVGSSTLKGSAVPSVGARGK